MGKESRARLESRWNRPSAPRWPRTLVRLESHWFAHRLLAGSQVRCVCGVCVCVRVNTLVSTLVKTLVDTLVNTLVDTLVNTLVNTLVDTLVSTPVNAP